MTKTQDCSASDCVNKYIKKGASGSVCANCQEVLKKFMKFASEAEEHLIEIKTPYGKNKPKRNN